MDEDEELLLQELDKMDRVHLMGAIDAGCTLVCIEDDDEWRVGDLVTAAGKPEVQCGYILIPIEPKGVVQLDFFDVA
eukprot:6766356-Karenia_brevis.AAC.1